MKTHIRFRPFAPKTMCGRPAYKVVTTYSKPTCKQCSKKQLALLQREKGTYEPPL